MNDNGPRIDQTAFKWSRARFWSSPRFIERDDIIANVLARPAEADIEKVINAFGRAQVEAIYYRHTLASPEVNPIIKLYSRRVLDRFAQQSGHNSDGHRYRFQVWAVDPHGTPVPCADLELDEGDPPGAITRARLHYHANYLTRDWAFAIQPRELPLSSEPHILHPEQECIPGFIQDLLPGGWGKRLIIQYRAAIDGLEFNPRSTAQLLHLAPEPFIGAFKAVPLSIEDSCESPSTTQGVSIADLEHLQDPEELLQHSNPAITLDHRSLSTLMQGCNIGGMRPKILCHDDQGSYIAKFSRGSDPFNVVALEAGAMTIARRAGLDTPEVELLDFGCGWQALKVRRFDIAENGGRRHLMTAKSLLKDSQTAADRLFPAYDDLVDLIRQWSSQPDEDCQRLFKQMLINQVFNNRDDHLGNFSFIRDQHGIRLSPAYDIVPEMTLGKYSALGRRTTSMLPRLSEAESAAKQFGLSVEQAREVASTISTALTNWEDVFRGFGTTEEEIGQLSQIIQCSL